MSNPKSIDDYFAIIRRRIHWIIWPALLIAFSGFAVATALPNIYRSEARILIEGQQVTETLVPTTVTSFVDQRIQSIVQQVMSRSKVLEIIKKFDLYKEQRDKLTTDALVDKFTEAIQILPISTEIKTSQSKSPSSLTIAFSLSFEARSPKKAQQVTNELASFFLAQNIEARKDTAKGTVDFLSMQVKTTKAELDQLQNQFSQFKEQHLEELPEFMNVNIQNLTRLDTELNNINREIVSLEEQNVITRNQFAALDPYLGETTRVLSDEEQLQQLELKRAELRARYSDKHPALRAIEREIEIIGSTASGGKGLQNKMDSLKMLEQELAQMRSKYSDQHPSVKKLVGQIEELKQEIEEQRKEMPASKQPGVKDSKEITNPAYLSMKSELERSEVRVKFLRKERQRILTEREELQNKLKTMPNVEKQYREYQMDYENAKNRLNELQQKFQVAKIAEGMEEGQLAEKFTLVEPPYLPEEPDKPNRKAILLIGIVLGIGMGFGLGFFREYLDHSIRTPEEVEQYAGYPVLAIIPKIASPKEVRKRRNRIIGVSVAAVVIPAAGLAIFHYYVMDLYVFYYRLARFLAERYYTSF